MDKDELFIKEQRQMYKRQDTMDKYCLDSCEF